MGVLGVITVTVPPLVYLRSSALYHMQCRNEVTKTQGGKARFLGTIMDESQVTY